ncbi:MAG: hypothetical protein ACRDGH_14625 [Candidatus Limnocylindria bacterium]
MPPPPSGGAERGLALERGRGPASRPGDEPADGEADLVVAHPDLGVLVIEVKGGRVGRIGGQW